MCFLYIDVETSISNINNLFENRFHSSAADFPTAYDQYDAPLGTFSDFLCGFTLGSALGFLMLLCVYDRNVTHRQRIGIIVGVLLNLILQKDYETSDSRSPVQAPTGN